MSSTMFSIRKSPQPRGFCRPSSFASRSGRLGLGDRARRRPRSVIRTTSSPSAAAHAIVDRQLRVGLVAVLDRVHRGLGDRGLQPLEPRGLEPERARPPRRPARIAIALVAGRARDRERRRRATGAGARSSPLARRASTSVMSSSCSQPSAVKPVELGRARASITSPLPARRRRRRAAAGSRTSHASAPCASATPSEWSSITWPGSSTASVSS